MDPAPFDLDEYASATNESGPLAELAGQVAAEPGCCSFFSFAIGVDAEGTTFGHTRTGAGGVLEVPVADLVGAGLLDPLASTDQVTEIAARSRAERELVAARQELAVTRTELESCWCGPSGSGAAPTRTVRPRRGPSSTPPSGRVRR